MEVGIEKMVEKVYFDVNDKLNDKEEALFIGLLEETEKANIPVIILDKPEEYIRAEYQEIMDELLEKRARLIVISQQPTTLKG